MNIEQYISLADSNDIPIFSINDINTILDLISKKPSQKSINTYYSNPFIYNIVTIIDQLAISKNLFTDREGE